MASPSIKPSHKGRLHKALGIPEGQPIPRARLEAAAKSKDPHMRQMANYALAARGWKKK
jgi:hypothetical protein